MKRTRLERFYVELKSSDLLDMFEPQSFPKVGFVFEFKEITLDGVVDQIVA